MEFESLYLSYRNLNLDMILILYNDYNFFSHIKQSFTKYFLKIRKYKYKLENISIMKYMHRIRERERGKIDFYLCYFLNYEPNNKLRKVV